MINKIKLERILSISMICFLFSCLGGTKDKMKNENSSLITLNEDKGIKEIISYYGGECEYGFRNVYSANEKNNSIFWLKVSNSQIIDSFSHIAEMPASNVAYLFYKNLEREKDDYDSIEIKLMPRNGNNEKYIYSSSHIRKVVNKMNLVNKIVNHISLGEYDSIKNYIKSNNLFQIDQENIIKTIKKIDPSFGKVKEFIPYGFKFSTEENGRLVLHISGSLIREKSHYFSISLDPNSSKDEIYYLNYEL